MSDAVKEKIIQEILYGLPRIEKPDKDLEGRLKYVEHYTLESFTVEEWLRISALEDRKLFFIKHFGGFSADGRPIPADSNMVYRVRMVIEHGGPITIYKTHVTVWQKKEIKRI